MLWERYGALVGAGPATRPVGDDGLSLRRIAERAELTVEETVAGSDDPVAQAAAILTESDERSEVPRTADGIERRRSEETVER